MTATIPFIKDCFDRFNKQMFAGELPEVPIVLSKARTFLGKMEFKMVRGWFGRILSTSDFRLKISTSFDLPQDYLEDVVLHEMIHYYIALKKIKDTSAHGKQFRAMMKQINTDFDRHITISYKIQPQKQ